MHGYSMHIYAHGAPQLEEVLTQIMLEHERCNTSQEQTPCVQHKDYFEIRFQLLLVGWNYHRCMNTNTQLLFCFAYFVCASQKTKVNLSACHLLMTVFFFFLSYRSIIFFSPLSVLSCCDPSMLPDDAGSTYEAVRIFYEACKLVLFVC